MAHIKQSTNRRWLILLVAVALLGLASSSASAQRYAVVGEVTAEGELSLHDWKFRTQISNGLRLEAVAAEISNGLAHAGLHYDDGCTAALLPLWDANGPLSASSASWEPGLVWVLEVDPSPTWITCEDNGCSDFADKPWEEWHCGNLGGERCTCTIITSGDQFSVYGTAYCSWSFGAQVPWVVGAAANQVPVYALDDTVKGQYIRD